MRVGVSLLLVVAAIVFSASSPSLADDASSLTSPPPAPAHAEANASDNDPRAEAGTSDTSGAPASASAEAGPPTESQAEVTFDLDVDFTDLASSPPVQELAETLDQERPADAAPSLTETTRSNSRFKLASELGVESNEDGEATVTLQLDLNGQGAHTTTAIPTQAYPVFRFLGWPIGPHGDGPENEPPSPAPADADARARSADAVPVAAPSLAALAAGTLLVGATAGAAGLLVVPGWRTALARFLKTAVGFGLFTRLSGDDVLAHPRRNEIVEYVRQNPGERLEIARRALNIPNGVMLHHVRMLVHGNVLRVHRVDGMTRLYLAGPRVRPAPYVPPLRRRLLEELQRAPGATQRQIAQTFGLSERVVSYHVGRLAQRGLLSVQRDGSAKRCYPVAPAAAA